MFFWARWLGTIAGAMSLFSLMQKLFDLKLAIIFHDLLVFYRALLHPVANWIMAPFSFIFAVIGIKFPYIPPDVIIIYLLLGASLGRGVFSLVGNNPNVGLAHYSISALSADKTSFATARLAHRKYRYFLFAFVLLEWPVFLIELRASWSLIVWLIEIAKVIFGFLILFATNAYFSA